MHLTSIQNTAFTILRSRGYIPMLTSINLELGTYWMNQPEYKAALKQAEHIWKCAEKLKQKRKQSDVLNDMLPLPYTEEEQEDAISK